MKDEDELFGVVSLLCVVQQRCQRHTVQWDVDEAPMMEPYRVVAINLGPHVDGMGPVVEMVVDGPRLGFPVQGQDLDYDGVSS